MGAINKAALLAKRAVETRAVDIPGVGEVVVRGLTRAEALDIQQAGDKDAGEMDALLIAMCLVEPKLTVDEAREWQKVALAAELSPVSDAIQELSGLRVAEVKESMKRFRG